VSNSLKHFRRQKKRQRSYSRSWKMPRLSSLLNLRVKGQFMFTLILFYVSPINGVKTTSWSPFNWRGKWGPVFELLKAGRWWGLKTEHGWGLLGRDIEPTTPPGLSSNHSNRVWGRAVAATGFLAFYWCHHVASDGT